MGTQYHEIRGKYFLQEAVNLLREGKAEDVLRHALSANLPLMFPEQPWWVKAHAAGSESLANFYEHGTSRRGFVDVLLGSTVIEYERDLRKSGAFHHGLHQVRQYCSAQLNEGVNHDLLIGILSDTVHWHAFQVSGVKPLNSIPGATMFGPEHVELLEIESCDLSAAGNAEAKELGRFLIRYLGREGGRRLAANTLAKDLGFESDFCQEHIAKTQQIVDSAFSDNPEYSGLIKKLWTDFVSYLGGEAAGAPFDKTSYVAELYILTLAKLICANVLSSRGLASNDEELRSILDGSFFKARGLPNLVEYDYFGWLNTSPYVATLLEIARTIQDDLRAYDFESSPAEDLFGSLMAQLAERSQRLLLGQEWTPAWLAAKIVNRALEDIPSDQQPKFIDMCCGSGAIVVETVKAVQKRILARGATPGEPDALRELTSAITAFDIDPLAVILAKVGWILTSKDWLVPGIEAQIPVYHADSLFVNTPITKSFGASGEEHLKLLLDKEEVALPQFLIEPSHQALFDALLSRGYEMAMSSASEPATSLDDSDIETMLDSVTEETGGPITDDEKALALDFLRDLLRALEALERAGRNGVWAFVLRNSFRPSLVAGRFNGIVTNPPWLALSRIGSNPYRDALKNKAAEYGIEARGSSHLHVEIATTFLLQAIDRYLAPDGTIACILPDTVLNGSHHEPFRQAQYSHARRPVAFEPREIWKIERQTFKNEAITLFGGKTSPLSPPTVFTGLTVGRNTDTKIDFHVVSTRSRSAWTPTCNRGSSKQIDEHDSVDRLFRQGADVMPRGIIFHNAERSGKAWNLQPIAAGSKLFYLRSDSKLHKHFELHANGVSDQVVFDALISKHLAPWELADGSKALLPIKRGENGWEPRKESGIAALGTSTHTAIKTALNTLGQSSTEFFERIDTDRKKLRNQSWADDEYIVIASAGGKLPCAAFVQGSQIPCSKSILDQTLYWAKVRNKDEAIFITALINSPATIDEIVAYQPRGAFGERHIHKLAFKRIPRFDSASTEHKAVVRTAKRLIGEWSVRRAHPEILPYLAPHVAMTTRRRKIRTELESLPSWDAYEAATRNLYKG